MSTVPILRAIRDFCAPTHPTVRLAPGEQLDFSRPDVQAFFRANLRWDAFAVDFVADHLSPEDLAKVRIELVAALALMDDARVAARAAQAEYAQAQEDQAALDHQISVGDQVAVKTGKPQPPEAIAAAHKSRGEARLRTIDARERFTAAHAAAGAAVEAAGRLSAQLRAAGPSPAVDHIESVGEPVKVMATLHVGEATGIPLEGAELKPGETGTATSATPKPKPRGKKKA